VQQLFSLNQNLVNFKALFSVSSLSQEPFLGIVVDQQTLDSGEALEFKSADKGLFSGDITQDNNIATNWYLVLKSAKPNKVAVNIQSFPIPGKPQQPQQDLNPILHAVASHDSHGSSSSWKIPSYRENRQLYLILGGIVGVGLMYVGYKYYYLPRMLKRSKSSKGHSKLDGNSGERGDELLPELAEIGGSGIGLSGDSKSPSSLELEKSVESIISQPLKVVENLQPVPKVVTDDLGGDILQEIEKQIENIKLPPV
jgi:hypothetical protein